jgi:predicted metalloprotease
MNLDGQEESTNVEDRRGMGVKGGAALGGGGLLLVLVLSLLLHKNPAQVASVIQGGGGSGQPQQVDPKQEPAAHFTKVIFGDTEKVWDEQFRKMSRNYPHPTLVLYTDRVESACGTAESSVGPFYCPGDQKVYIDLTFYDELKRKFKAPGEFAQAYVIAHEVGHHVQNLLGISEKVTNLQRQASELDAKRLSVMLELQADFFAGVWAHHIEKQKHVLETGDIESGLAAANAIGDDALQKQAQGYVVPDSFTHGSSAQRVQWFSKGLQTGDMNQGDTFNDPKLLEGR